MTDAVQSASIVSMFVIGLLGAGHCVGMCGGIATALGFTSQGNKSTLLSAGYNVGRIASYAMAGALVASLGYWGKTYLLLGPWLRITAGVLLILMGCYLANWWRVLISLEKVGNCLWQRLRPLGNRLLPVTGLKQALLLGMVWGWLPCGLVYAALAYAATADTPPLGALMMCAFGIGTTPAMLIGSLASERVRHVLQGIWQRRVMAVIMIGFGVWSVNIGMQHFRPSDQHAETPAAHSEHQHH